MAKLKFDPADRELVELLGSNLVEASAGTGKTYSIGILVIRLVVEKELPIDKILMVTFTNAAVAELEDRVRKFIRLAYKAARGQSIEDEGIESLIQEYLRDPSIGGTDKVVKLLENARLSLDDTSIFTIHSFCQRTLTEFAFETGQLYGMDLLNNIDDVIHEEVDQYWRVNVAGLSKELIQLIQSHNISGSIKLNRKVMLEFTKQCINGTTYAGDIYTMDQLLDDFDRLIASISTNIDTIKASLWAKQPDIPKFSVAQAQIWADLLEEPIEFFKELFKSKGQHYKPIIFKKQIEDFREYQGNVANAIAGVHSAAANSIIPRVKDRLLQNKSLSTNDLISNLHAALDFEDSSALITAMRNKYKAVFVDEFQDTDGKQYEIFSRVFTSKSSVIFYIGDPKQSIYSFRQADINTYFKASDEVDKIYGMETNYRSSANLIEAMNAFFTGNQKPNFDTFYTYNGNGHTIDYIEVNAKKEACQISIEGQVEKSLMIYKDYTNDSDICSHVGNKIVKLLKNGLISNTEQKITTTDIVVLVRNKYQAIDVKKELNRRNVPCLILSDQKVFDSEEGKYIAQILNAVIDPKRNKINLALLTPLTGYTYMAVEHLDDAIKLERFKKLSQAWENEGVYSVLKEFAKFYNLENVLLGDGANANGERIISNYFQIAEILQRSETENKFSQNDLIRFLSRNINDTSDDNDEFVQRIESDESAVRIVTIHKSKGLEYNIVFAPFMDMEAKERKSGFSTFRSVDNTYYHSFVGHLGDNKNLFLTEQEQENRRILYVALTRAKYACYLFKKEESKNTTFDTFYSELIKAQQLNHNIFIGNYGVDQFEKWESGIVNAQKVYLELPQISIQDSHWRKMSYSYLSGDHAYVKKELKNPDDQSDYDNFIFKELPKGAHVGNLLHNMFEFIDYTDSDSDKIEKAVSDSLRIFLPKYKTEFQEPLEEMVNTVLSAEIEIAGESFKLNQVGNESKKTELEFDFMTNKFNVGALNELREHLPDGFDMHTGYNEEIEGVLTGFIDLFFKHNGKYYILDWKSNFLGDVVEDYSEEKLITAMSDSNYHLQYMIYSLAIKKYLESNLNDFDYEKHFGGVIYLFLRGVREGSQKGVFTYKPGIEIIDKLETIFSND